MQVRRFLLACSSRASILSEGLLGAMVKHATAKKGRTQQKSPTKEKDREDLRISVRARLSQEEVCLLSKFRGSRLNKVSDFLAKNSNKVLDLMAENEALKAHNHRLRKRWEELTSLVSE